MENINLKAAILAVILLVFTYSFYMGERGSALSIWVPIIFGVIAIVMLVVYFFSIKLIAYAIASKIYPNIGLRIFLPFITFSFLAWLIYAFTHLKPFGNTADFVIVFKVFATKHMLFIGICTIVIGLTFSYPLTKMDVIDHNLLKKNLVFLAIVLAIFTLSVYLFFISFKIKQPSLAAKYLQYKSLDEAQPSENFEIVLLISADEYNYLAKPYFLPNKNEAIIISHYGNNNKHKPIRTIYRLNTDGKIIETVNDSVDLRSGDLHPMIAIDGILIDENKGKEVITWVFDGNKTRQQKNDFTPNKNWIIDSLNEENDLIKAVHFQKTAKFNCGNLNNVKYNGDRYYELKKDNELLTFKLDSVYYYGDNLGNCEEKQLDYYTSNKINFSLIRLNHNKYYIVKPKKK